VEAVDHTWRIYHDNGVVGEVARTTTKPVARFNVHKPEPKRRHPDRPAPAPIPTDGLTPVQARL
jgi:hypothetical protein